MKKRNYNLIIGTSITLFFLAAAVIGRFWTPYGATAMDSLSVNLAPCLTHPMGTDNFGRDIFKPCHEWKRQHVLCGCLHRAD